jgi:hypothetical protein
MSAKPAFLLTQGQPLFAGVATRRCKIATQVEGSLIGVWL